MKTKASDRIMFIALLLTLVWSFVGFKPAYAQTAAPICGPGKYFVYDKSYGLTTERICLNGENVTEDQWKAQFGWPTGDDGSDWWFDPNTKQYSPMDGSVQSQQVQNDQSAQPAPTIDAAQTVQELDPNFGMYDKNPNCPESGDKVIELNGHQFYCMDGYTIDKMTWGMLHPQTVSDDQKQQMKLWLPPNVQNRGGEDLCAGLSGHINSPDHYHVNDLKGHDNIVELFKQLGTGNITMNAFSDGVSETVMYFIKDGVTYLMILATNFGDSSFYPTSLASAKNRVRGMDKIASEAGLAALRALMTKCGWKYTLQFIPQNAKQHWYNRDQQNAPVPAPAGNPVPVGEPIPVPEAPGPLMMLAAAFVVLLLLFGAARIFAH